METEIIAIERQFEEARRFVDEWLLRLKDVCSSLDNAHVGTEILQADHVPIKVTASTCAHPYACISILTLQKANLDLYHYFIRL